MFERLAKILFFKLIDFVEFYIDDQYKGTKNCVLLDNCERPVRILVECFRPGLRMYICHRKWFEMAQVTFEKWLLRSPLGTMS